MIIHNILFGIIVILIGLKLVNFEKRIKLLELIEIARKD